MATNKEVGITDEMLDQLLAGRDPATVFESGGLIDELKKRLAERMLNGELDHHLKVETAVAVIEMKLSNKVCWVRFTVKPAMPPPLHPSKTLLPLRFPSAWNCKVVSSAPLAETRILLAICH